MLEFANMAHGTEYRGYKGGQFYMNDETEIHINNEGECSIESNSNCSWVHIELEEIWFS